MDITIAPRLLKGRITPPPSKSQAHRALIAAALAGGGSRIENLADSQDIQGHLPLSGGPVRAQQRPASAGLRGIRLHPALSHPPFPGPPGRRPFYRPREADGAPAGALFSPF